MIGVIPFTARSCCLTHVTITTINEVDHVALFFFYKKQSWKRLLAFFFLNVCGFNVQEKKQVNLHLRQSWTMHWKKYIYNLFYIKIKAKIFKFSNSINTRLTLVSLLVCTIYVTEVLRWSISSRTSWDQCVINREIVKWSMKHKRMWTSSTKLEQTKHYNHLFTLN